MKKQIMFLVLAALTINAFSQNIIKGEYFIDSDPGFGNATEFLIALPDSDLTQLNSIPYESFPGPGYHNLFLRTLDSDGNWSHTSRSFIEADEVSDLGKVIKVEYFFNSDNGFGNNAFVLIEPKADETWNFSIPFAHLPSEWKANDTLLLRVQDGSKNNWSHTALIDSLNFIMVGVMELEEFSGVSVFPNPFSNEINVSLKKTDKVKLVLYNEVGQIVFNKKVNNSEIINTQFITPGFYVMVIYSDSQKLYGTKIVKY